MSSVRITLAGGQPLETRGVMLYEEALLLEATSLWRQAEAKAGPAAGQFGFFGSPSFVFGAVAAASIFESWRTRRLDKEAVALADQAAEKYDAALATARYFAWSDVTGVEWPEPARWHASAFEDLKRKRFVPKLGGEVCIDTQDGEKVWVLWSHVALYQLIRLPAAV